MWDVEKDVEDEYSYPHMRTCYVLNSWSGRNSKIQENCRKKLPLREKVETVPEDVGYFGCAVNMVPRCLKIKI